MSAAKILNNVRLIQKCIIINREGNILALKRDADDHSRGGNWDLPGGGYEQGEDVLDAIKREVREEAGITVNSVTPLFFMNKIGVTAGFFQGSTVFGICYTSANWSGEITLSDEHIEYRWVTPEEFLTFDFGDDSGFFVSSMRCYNSKYAENFHAQ